MSEALKLRVWRPFSTQNVGGHRPGMEGGLGLSERPFSKAGKDDKELFLEMGRA